ncbi:acetoin dehydrogenase E2 subunit dihydrolipoyllysine-residue acetyltransferase [Hartmannibacter diazotrophicus]|uniref:Acetoin dehydrogenase E2 subunit dihydrolipoyllysine-residue acetyltransferase n=1 Tax=Hartmannibacter diazotrophicus TaxID=1482074 RepID=A0A2C9D618_9HYPH|nr:alpha/beta hydrolase [Hartmannibacter diazotrophicus]SON55609.1 acetoin dehydrogenase E2 subunit dihydrolipoyllysine-residue acetyltransferase [Hartmannibacter diazotrophicus]
MSIRKVIAAATVATTAIGSAAIASEKPSVVLVHGAWANGSSWSKVVPLLQAQGLNVVAVHNPLSSFEADVAATRRVIEDQPGDVVLVGHSYGGAVITEAGNSDKVRALVYVAAFAPSEGQSINAIVGAAPHPPEWLKEVHADTSGVLSWSAQGMAHYFAPDIPADESALLAATQAPLANVAFDGKVTTAAFTQKPSWYVVADNDQIIPPVLQQIFADTMKATVVHVPSSHVAMLSQPQAVADAIVAAVDSIH